MESNGVVENGLKMVLEMMKGDQYDNVNEAISDGIDICIDFFHFYQNNPGEYNGHTSDEYICMAEHVKKKLSKFQDDNHDEFIFFPTLMDKLTEMFPNKETKLLLAKAKAYLEDLNERDSNENLGSVVNRIALELLNIEDSNEETEEETPPCSPD